MSSELKASWSGPLKSKRKNELQQICRQLGIDYKSDSLKADLEQQIRQQFKDSPDLQDDERFINLDHNGTSASPNTSGVISSRRSNRARSLSRPPREHDDDDQPSSVEEDRGRSQPSKVHLPSHNSSASTNSEQAVAQNILVTLINPEHDDSNHQSNSKSNSNVTQSSTSHIIQQIGQQILDSFHTFTRRASCFIVTAIQVIQETFSSPWKLCVIAILLELIFVIYSTIPLHQNVNLKSNGIYFNIKEPIIRLFNQITSKNFLIPLIEYSSLTILIPIIISGLMNNNVSNSKYENNTTSRKQDQFKLSRDLIPNVFIYCATRLAILALIHLVFYPNHRFGWSYQLIHHNDHTLHHHQQQPILSSTTTSPLGIDQLPHQQTNMIRRNIHLSGFESIQYVTTTFSMVFSLYQLIRSFT